MDFIVCDDFRLIGIIAGLGNVKAVSRTFVPVRYIRIIGSLEGYSLAVLKKEKPESVRRSNVNQSSDES